MTNKIPSGSVGLFGAPEDVALVLKPLVAEWKRNGVTVQPTILVADDTVFAMFDRVHAPTGWLELPGRWIEGACLLGHLTLGGHADRVVWLLDAGSALPDLRPPWSVN